MTDEEKKAWDILEDDAMRQLSMAATHSRFPLIVAAGCEMRALRAVSKAAQRFYDANGTVDWRTAKGVGEWNESACELNGALRALSAPPAPQVVEK